MTRPLLLLLALLFLLSGCVSTRGGGRKFDPWEGAKRIDENIADFIDRQSST